jgi:hypothetical protein
MKITKKDIISRIENIIDPDAPSSKIANLLEMIGNMPPPSSAPMVGGNVPTPPEPTPENMAATIANPELPKPKSFPFERIR